MENTNEINRRIADNLIRFRKEAGYTQAELAEKINYSDKSVSKWESGNGIPDVYTLMQLAQLYGVTLDDFVGTGKAVKVEKKTDRLRILIMLLSSGIVWLAATLFYVVMQILFPQGDWWVVFLYATMANAILLIVFAGIWHYRLLNFFSVSTLIWVSITCAFITTNIVLESQGKPLEGLWQLFVIGAPLQALEILWVFFRSVFQKTVKIKERISRKRKVKKKKNAKNTKDATTNMEK